MSRKLRSRRPKVTSTAKARSTWPVSPTCSNCARSSRAARRPRPTSISIRRTTPRRAPGSELFQLDLAVDFVRQVDVADGQHHLRRHALLAFELAAVGRGAHGLLDFLLRRHAHHLEEFA